MTKKMRKIYRKIAFLECYQTLEIVFWTIFHCTPKHLDFNFLTRIHFPLHSFYTRNSIYIKPNTAFKTFYVKWKTLLIFLIIFYFLFIKVVLKLFKNNSLINILKVLVNKIHFVIMNWVRKGEHWMNLVAGLHKSFWKWE